MPLIVPRHPSPRSAPAPGDSSPRWRSCRIIAPREVRPGNQGDRYEGTYEGHEIELVRNNVNKTLELLPTGVMLVANLGFVYVF
jgi:hypothetical protein